LRLYSYVVARDFGFAPNPFHGFCTLATCKPNIRKSAQPGDWIIGTGSKSHGLDGRLVYAMRVTETLDFDEYWSDERFRAKRPSLHGSVMQAYGDNIYHRDGRGGWVQENSHHSLKDGSPNQDNVDHDTKTDRVLASNEFTYWGDSGPSIPERFRDWGGLDVCAGRGHRCVFPDDLIRAFTDWLLTVWGPGYRGRPAEW
jgi:putative DNA base modification enzyme with NMAD domain